MFVHTDNVELDEKRGLLIDVLFFFLAFGGVEGWQRDRVSQGVKGSVPVLSDGNINYSGTTIKRKRRWMPIECRKLETRRVRKETKGGQMEKKPRG